MIDNPPAADLPEPSDAPIKPEGFDGHVAMARNGRLILVCSDHGRLGTFATAWDDDYLEAIEEHADTMHGHASFPSPFDELSASTPADLERLGTRDPSDATPEELPSVASGPIQATAGRLHLIPAPSNALPDTLRNEARYTRAVTLVPDIDNLIADAFLRLANRIEAARNADADRLAAAIIEAQR